ncbi:MAG: hypothetical protein JW716_05465 [Candidatus Aenigmarchaeota archaeon]|nr:hypothetical protein [Candidatus Aenigmarchaeota archaeon]
MTRTYETTIAIVFSLIAIIILASGASSLGIGAFESTDFIFEPNKKVDITVVISNSLDSYLPIVTYVEGETSEYFTLHGEPNAVLSPRGSTQFTYTLTMPEKFDTPGEHNAFIFASELPPEEVGGMAGIIRIGRKVFIRVPYPGKYVDITEFNIYNPNINQKVDFSIKTINRGSIDIENVYADIDIYDAGDKLIDSVITNSLRGVPGQEIEIKTDWLAVTKPGRHKAIATVNYDGETVAKEKIFNIGSPSIKITDIISNPIQNGSVGKIEIGLESEWNLRIDDVFVNLIVKKDNGEKIADLKSETINIEPWSKPRLNIFWDTNGVGTGNYTGTVAVYYLNETETAETVISIVPLSANINMYINYLAVFVVVLAVVVGVLAVRRRRGPRGYYIKSFK